MSPIVTAIVSFALILGSVLLGTFLRSKLPERHLTGDSKDVIRLGTALIGTMAAIVLALLFASTRTSYEQTSGDVSRLTADMIELDLLLKDYGPEATAARETLRDSVEPLIDSLWRENAIAAGREALPPKPQAKSVLYMIRQLQPQNTVQAALQARAVQVSADLSQVRLVLFSQPPDSILRPFAIAMVLWLSFIFATFSMTAKPNPTLTTILGLSILSVAGSIYLIRELGTPFDGLMQVSSEALRHALRPL